VPLYSGGHLHSRNFSTSTQAVAANTVTYLTNSGILVPSTGMVVGQTYRWEIHVGKTAAGTAGIVWTPRLGTNQTTADSTLLSVTGTAQVATASGTIIYASLFVRTVSATGVVVFSVSTGAASFGIGGTGVSGAVNNASVAGQRVGLCVNTGASAAWSVNAVVAELWS
jgi:hypothetical protein